MPKSVKPQGQAAKPAGADIPPARKRAAKKKPTPRAAASPDNGAKYIRNIRAILVRLTLDTGRTIHLQPRGQRGDLAPVNVDEQLDSIYLQNANLLFEVLEPAQAIEIMAKQNTNATSTGPTALDVLTDEHGRPITKVEVTSSHESQGITIGTIEQGPGTRNMESTEVITRGVQPQSVPAPGTVQNPVVGNDNVPIQYGDPISQAIAEGGVPNVSVDPPRQG